MADPLEPALTADGKRQSLHRRSDRSAIVQANRSAPFGPCRYWGMAARSLQDGQIHQGSLLRCRCRPFGVEDYPSLPLSDSCHPGPKPWFPSRSGGKERGDHTNRRSSTTETTSIHPLPPDPGWPPRIGHLLMSKTSGKVIKQDDPIIAIAVRTFNGILPV